MEYSIAVVASCGSVNCRSSSMASLSFVRERKRKRRPKCNQDLSHSAYNLHKNPAVCPEKDIEVQKSAIDQKKKKILLETDIDFKEPSLLDGASTANLESASVDVAKYRSGSATSILQQNTKLDSDVDDRGSSLKSVSGDNSENVTSAEESESTLCGSSDEKEIADTEESYLENYNRPSSKQSNSDVAKENTMTIALHICMFLSFFQMCYRVSEHGISLLLTFLRALLLWICSVCPNSSHVKILHDVLPPNIP